MNVVAAMPEMTKEHKERELRYQAEEDMRALQRVAEIRKSPARMKLVRKLLKGVEGALGEA